MSCHGGELGLRDAGPTLHATLITHLTIRARGAMEGAILMHEANPSPVLTARIVPTGAAAAVRDGDGLAVCHLPTATAYAITPAGAEIWNAIGPGVTLRQLVATLALDPEEQQDECAAVQRFVEELVALGLVQIVAARRVDEADGRCDGSR